MIKLVQLGPVKFNLIGRMQKRNKKNREKRENKREKSAVVQKVTGSTLDDVDFSFFPLRVS